MRRLSRCCPDDRQGNHTGDGGGGLYCALKGMFAWYEETTRLFNSPMTRKFALPDRGSSSPAKPPAAYA